MNWKRPARLMSAMVIGLLASANLDAQDAVRHDFARGYPAQRLSLMERASEADGTMVWDRSGNKLGRIRDFLVEPGSWRVVCALVTPANLYGSKDYYIAVPAGSFLSADVDRAVVNTTMTNFIGQPRFYVNAGRDAKAMSKSLKEMYERFGQKIFWDEKTGLEQLTRTSAWLGREVNDQSGVNIGEVTDFVLDLPAERMLFAVVSFFGWDANEHVVPPAALAVAPMDRGLRLEVDPARIGSLVLQDDYLQAEFADPAWTAAAYRAFGEQLALESIPTAASDTARMKVRNLSERPITFVESPPVVALAPTVPAVPIAPVVKGSDANLARAVTTAILRADDAGGLRDIKVSALGGKVRLMGQVGSETQKSSLEKIAQGVAGAGNVKNDLEVK